MDSFPDPDSLTAQELTALIKQLTEEELTTEEAAISYRRRVLHGKSTSRALNSSSGAARKTDAGMTSAVLVESVSRDAQIRSPMPTVSR